MTYKEILKKVESQDDCFCAMKTDKGDFILPRLVLSKEIRKLCDGSIINNWDCDCQVTFKFNGKLENFLILDIQTGDLIQI